MQALRYRDFEIGLCFTGTATITESHVTGAAELFGDFNPIHLDEEVARNSIHGKRILHGPCVVGLMMATVGDTVAGTGIGELGLTFRFRKPTYVEDTLTWTWTVRELTEKPRHHGGIVVFDGTCANQHGATVVTAETTVLVANRSMFPAS